MTKKAKPPSIIMTEGKREIIRQLLNEYDIKTAEDIQEALKDLLGGTIKEKMEAEMGYHLGYEKSARSDSDNARNSYKSKRVNSSYGNFSVEVPQDRNSTFEPQIVPKRKKDISSIDRKIISITRTECKILAGRFEFLERPQGICRRLEENLHSC